MKILRSQFIFLLVLMVIVSCTKREKREVHYENGQLKEQFKVIKTKDDNYLKDGKYVLFYENGQKREEGKYKKGNLKGKIKIWYESGKIKETAYFKDNLLNGKHERFSEEGALLSDIQYKDGTWHGDLKIYMDEKKLIEGQFLEGKANGVFTLFERDGETILSTVEMENGLYLNKTNAFAASQKSANANFMGFELGKATYPDVKLGFLNKGIIMGESSDVNAVSKGRIIFFDASEIGLDFVKNGTFIFNEEQILVGVRYSMDKNIRSRHSAGFGAGFHSMYAYFKDEGYKLVNKRIPFVGNTSATFKRHNSHIFLDAPHLNFEMTVNYWLDNYKRAVL